MQPTGTALDADWLGACRGAVDGLRAVLRDHPRTRQRAVETGDRGEGGDRTLVIDEGAEHAVFAQLDALHAAGHRFTAVSEERGEIDYGGADIRVVIDPIDGSLNAKRLLPHYALSIAVADGPTMADVVFGYVFDFGAGEEWTATRGEGAWLDGAPLGAIKPKDTIDILSLEATRSPLVARDAPKVAELAYRMRIMGSLALSLCHLAAGRVDAVCSLKAARSVDIAAAQLLVRELGLAIDLFDVASPFGEAPLDLEGRSRVAAAGTAEICGSLTAALLS